MDIETLLTREAIRDCLTRFCRGMDRFDRELYLSAFHDDTIVAAGPFVGSAADCYDWAQPMHQQMQLATQHCILNTSFDIDGDTAHTETYYQFVARNCDGSNWLTNGRYVDRLECRNEDGHKQWKIALRTNVIEWSGNVPAMPLPFADVPDINDNGAPARDNSDISYQRPLSNRRKPYNPARD